MARRPSSGMCGSWRPKTIITSPRNIAGAALGVARLAETKRVALDVGRIETGRREHVGVQRGPEREVTAEAPADRTELAGRPRMAAKMIEHDSGVGVIRRERRAVLVAIPLVSPICAS